MSQASKELPRISLTTKEAAKKTGLSVRMLQLETKAGRVPAARKIGRTYIYLLDELIDFMRNLPRPGAN